MKNHHPSDHEKLLLTIYQESANLYTQLCEELLTIDPNTPEEVYHDLAFEVVEAEIRLHRSKADLLEFQLTKSTAFEGVQVPDHLPEEL
jgi:hypothetical protein